MEFDPNSSCMKRIKSHLETMKKLRLIPRGVKTNLLACKDYLSKLNTFLKSKLKKLFRPLFISIHEAH